MKVKFAAGLALSLCAAFLTFGADGSWTGYISDSDCGAKGSNEKHAACATKCVKEKGAKYVFVNDADHKVYTIDDQDRGSGACRPSRRREGYGHGRRSEAHQPGDGQVNIANLKISSGAGRKPCPFFCPLSFALNFGLSVILFRVQPPSPNKTFPLQHTPFCFPRQMV